MTEATDSQISVHMPRMYRVALRLLANDELARDVVQEACVKALTGINDFDGRATLATWLHRITVNCAMDAIRCQKKREFAFSSLEVKASRMDGAIAPQAAVELKEQSDIALALIEKLPDDCRSAFILTQLDAYSYDEAAQLEGQPRGTIASRVYRAKKILLEQMNAQDGRAAQ